MNFDSIGNLVKKTKHCDPKSLGRNVFTYIDISSVDRLSKQIVSPQILSTQEAPSRARKVIHANDVILSTVRPNLNTVAYVPNRFDGEIASTGFCVLRADDESVNPRYLFYFTQTNAFVAHLTRLATGAGYPAVSDTDVLESAIPLPPTVTEQKRIATILDKADRLRLTRRYAQQLSDTFLQSVFVEMFGDPVKNPKGWDVERLFAVCEKFIDYRGRTPAYSEKGIKHVTSSCVKDSRIDWSKTKYVSEETFAVYMTRGLPEQDDIIFTTEAPMGETAVVDTKERFSLAQRMVLLRPKNNKTSSLYVSRLLSHPDFFNTLNRFATGSTVKGISSESLQAVPIPLPPYPLQEKFARIVQRFERLRAQQREAARQAEHLFQTLLHRAFRGEL